MRRRQPVTLLKMRGSRNPRSPLSNCPSVVKESTSTTKSGGDCTRNCTWTNPKKLNYGKMTSAVADDEKVYLPLIFFFNRNPGLALPLIALQYHEVRIDFDLASSVTTNFDSLKVWGNYIYLDTEERRRFAQKGHEYLIEQVQHTGTDSLAVAAATKQIRLSYNHPVKELVWCTSNTAAMVTTNNCGTLLTPQLLSFQCHCSRCRPQTCSSTQPPRVRHNCSWTPRCNSMKKLRVHCRSFKLVLNGQDRFKEQGGKYFNHVQPFVHHSASPMPGIYSYSFALKPEEHQPTGTCNFSRIDNAQVSIALYRLLRPRVPQHVRDELQRPQNPIGYGWPRVLQLSVY